MTTTQQASICAGCGQTIYYSTYRDCPGARYEPDYDPSADPTTWRHTGGYASCIGGTFARPATPAPLTMAGIGQRGLADSKAWFPRLHDDPLALLTHYGLGVAGEVGELVNLIKKANRDREMPTGERLDMIRAEIADVTIYLCDIAAHLGIDPTAAVEEKRSELIERWGQP